MNAMDASQWQAEQFEQSRGHLRAVAYRMLGSAAEADDAVQETWLRFARTDTAAVENLRARLTTVVSRVCLDMLRARRARREELVDIPDVTIEDDSDPEQEAMLADSVGVALLVVLEEPCPAAQGRGGVPGRVAQRGLREALVAVLHPDTVFRADRGADLAPGAMEITGAQQVANVVLARGTPFAPFARHAVVDGRAGVFVKVDDRLRSVVKFTIEGDRVVAMDLTIDPDTLARLRI
jgi:RNA polymerase sigma-70 factor, ECF subfamily